MGNDPVSWVGDAVLPNLRAGLAYRVFAPDAYPRIKDIVERSVRRRLGGHPRPVADRSGAERGGDLKAMEALVDQCMADYDENGWIGETWLTTGTGQPSR
jgi:hypothetical protein